MDRRPKEGIGTDEQAQHRRLGELIARNPVGTEVVDDLSRKRTEVRGIRLVAVAPLRSQHLVGMT